MLLIIVAFFYEILFTGTRFGEGHEAPPHAWNAVYFNGGWRLVDCTWAAGKFSAATKEFQKAPNDYFFLVDPDQLIYTHFPYDEAEKNYHKWQLLNQPIDLETFNSRPLLTSMFFDYSLKLNHDLECPIVTSGWVDVKIKAWELVRYKYKFFKNHQVLFQSYTNRVDRLI